jgi:hypothetical protein
MAGESVSSLDDEVTAHPFVSAAAGYIAPEIIRRAPVGAATRHAESGA